jgi:hypothetical protein
MFECFSLQILLQQGHLPLLTATTIFDSTVQ